MSKRNEGWNLDNVVQVPEGTTFAWSPINRILRALVHWGTFGGRSKRVVCPGGFNPRGNNPRECPICAYIVEHGQAERGQEGWREKRQFYFPVVEGKLTGKGKDRKLEFDNVVKLLGSSDGCGVRLFRALEACVKSPTGEEPPENGEPFVYGFEIVRTGMSRDTAFSVKQVPSNICVIPDMKDLEDPDLLLGEGLDKFIEPTPVDICNRIVNGNLRVEQKVNIGGAEPEGEAEGEAPEEKTEEAKSAEGEETVNFDQILGSSEQ